MSNDYLQDREDPKIFEAKLNAALAEAAKVDEAVIRNANTSGPAMTAAKAELASAYNRMNTDQEEVENRSLELAVQGWANYDELVAPGGLFANQPASEKLRLERDTYKDFGPRPAFKTAAEIAQEEQEQARLESARLKADNEEWIAQRLYDAGFANIDEAREWYAIPVSKRPPAPVPSLIETKDGVPAYVMPDGSLIEAYAVAFGKAARNPKFAEIAARVEKIQNARR